MNVSVYAVQTALRSSGGDDDEDRGRPRRDGQSSGGRPRRGGQPVVRWTDQRRR